MKILGRRFICKRSVIFGIDEIMYRFGKIYKSEIEGCITNEQGCKEHLWIVEDEDEETWKQVFRIIGNKRKSGGETKNRREISMH